MAKPNGLWWVLLGTALVACSRPNPEPEVQPAAAISPERPGAPAFVGLVMRDHELWLQMGSDGPLYTVKDKDGRVLADQIDGERLKTDYPELHWSPDGKVDVASGEVSGVGY